MTPRRHRVDQRGPHDDPRGPLGNPRQLPRQGGDRGRVEVDAGPGEVGGVGHEDRRLGLPTRSGRAVTSPAVRTTVSHLLHPVTPPDDVQTWTRSAGCRRGTRRLPVGGADQRRPPPPSPRSAGHGRPSVATLGTRRRGPGRWPAPGADEVVERPVAVGVLAQVGGDAGDRRRPRRCRRRAAGSPRRPWRRRCRRSPASADCGIESRGPRDRVGARAAAPPHTPTSCGRSRTIDPRLGNSVACDQGRRWAMYSAKDSLSHRSSHHRIVTRSPNHMCAISCAMVRARISSASSVAAPPEHRSSRIVTQPGFSIAPALNSGTNTWWYSPNGYRMPNSRGSGRSTAG